MSQYLYDEAIIAKLKNWTKGSDVHIYGPDETSRIFTTLADKNNDGSIELPMIVLNRDFGFTIRDGGQTRRPLSYDGLTLHADEDKSKIVNVIPISLDYTIDVYTKLYKESDILVRNLIFNIVNQPKLEVEIPDTSKFKCGKYEPFKHTARIELGSNLVKNKSNIKERFSEGNFTIMSILISIEDAYLWDVREHKNGTVEYIIDDVYEPYPKK